MTPKKAIAIIPLIYAMLWGTGCATSQRAQTEHLNKQGVECLQTNDLPKAHSKFVEAWKQEPANPETLYNLASTYHRRGQLREAEQYYRQALQQKPDFTVCRHNYYLLLISESRSLEAREDATRWLKSQPQSADALTQVGWLARLQGDQPLAQKNLQLALSINPHHTEALLEMGKLYQDYHMQDRARSMFTRALQSEPDNLEAQGLLAGLNRK